MKVLVVGAGLYGCTLARLLKDSGHHVEIAEKSYDIGGMCHTTVMHGIEVHDYGPHIFHTSDEWTWRFVNKFDTFNRYEHHVIAQHNGQHYFLPFNKMLLAQFFGQQFLQDDAAKRFLQARIDYDVERLGIDPQSPKNLEEQAISLVGADLYNAFIKNYTKKQWHKDPKELSSSIIKRIPVRFDCSISYYDDVYTGLPVGGYTRLISQIAYGVDVHYGMKMGLQDVKDALKWFDKVVYTGPLDELFGYKHGQLEWRSLSFETYEYDIKSYQGTPCINFADDDVPYTRIHEYKWYHPEKKAQLEQKATVIQTETPQDWSVDKPRFYPVSNEKTAELHKKYTEEASSINGLLVGGRLGQYKYYDMDDTIMAAREDAMKLFGAHKSLYSLHEQPYEDQ